MPKLVPTARDDRGMAMILVISTTIIMAMAATTALAYAVYSLKPARGDQDTNSARQAAQAGIDEYVTMLNSDDAYWQIVANRTKAWTAVPGASEAQYAYTVTPQNDGSLIMTAQGKTRDKETAVRALLRHRSTLDYVYFSEFETFYPAVPGAYLDAATAMALCGERHYYDPGPVGLWADPNQPSSQGRTYIPGVKGNPVTWGEHRNDAFCNYRGLGNAYNGGGFGEELIGKAHTNDIFWFSGGTVDGKVTESCLPNLGNCPEGTIRNHKDAGSNNKGEGRMDDNSCPTGSTCAGNFPSARVYKDVQTQTGSATFNKGNPGWAAKLDPPATNAALLVLARNGGCVFTGPTRVKFNANGTMQVTSPSTKQIEGPCNGLGGSSLADTWDGAQQTTATISTFITEHFNGVIYIQDVPSSGPNAVSGGQVAGSCSNTNGKPYIRSSAVATDVFPSAYDNSANQPTKWFDCTYGSLFVEGVLHGAVTFGTEKDALITGNLYYSQSTKINYHGYDVYWPPSQCPESDICDILGIVSNRYVSPYHPTTGIENQGRAGAVPDDYKEVVNPTISAALFALQACWTTQNFQSGTDGQLAFVLGSIGHRYRCPMGDSAKGGYGHVGYDKHYIYDSRLAYLSPPHMLDLFATEWTVAWMGLDKA